VGRHPERLQGFATLATPSPRLAAAELQRAVVELGLNGAMVNARSGDCNVDAIEFWDIYEAAADLRAPIYLHPRAPRPVVNEAYYGGFGDPVDGLLATGAIGWHFDAGLTLLRMITGGLFDRFPDLQVILGHWGEVVLFYLDRIAVLDRVRQTPATRRRVLRLERLRHTRRDCQPEVLSLGRRDRRRGTCHVCLGLSVQPGT